MKRQKNAENTLFWKIFTIKGTHNGLLKYLCIGFEKLTVLPRGKGSLRSLRSVRTLGTGGSPVSGVWSPYRTEDGGLKTGVHTGRKTEEAEEPEGDKSGARVAREWLIREKPHPGPPLKGREGGE